MSKQSEQTLCSSFLGALNDDATLSMSFDFWEVSHHGKGEYVQQQCKDFCPFALDARRIILCDLPVGCPSGSIFE